MNKKDLSLERKLYLKKSRQKKVLIILAQLFLLISFLLLWELLANNDIIDSFITSSPSRIANTFMNLTSNDLLRHIGVTAYETIIGFLLGTFLGIIIAIILWWSDFLAKVSEPFLVVLNSLPKVALRTNHYYMGWRWNPCYYSNGNCYLFGCYHFRKFKWFFKNR